MGQEATIEFRFGRECAEVKAHLDSQGLQLGGGRKLSLKLGDIERAAATMGAATATCFVYRRDVKPNGDDIIKIARSHGLKDTKVARVSDDYAALRFIRARD
jgi:hypothetical protein